MLEPMPVHAIISIDRRYYFGILGGVVQQVVQCARLEPAKWIDMKEPEARS